MKLAILILLFFSVSVSCLPPKHIYVPTSMPWVGAQANCRRLYTDLSPILSAEEDAVFKQSGGQYGNAWIGLYRDEGTALWMWSGAGWANYTNFPPQYLFTGYYYYYTYYKYGVWTMDGWRDASEKHSYPSFCFNLIVIDQRMSWEDALMYCRERHTELTSLLSGTETQLALSELKSDHISERVWIGLRFLVDQWMWMSGESLNYTAWAHDGDFMDWHCPQRGRCGALSKEGVWEDWNCDEKLNFICH